VTVFFKIACAGAAAMSLVITFAVGRSPESVPAPPAPPAPVVAVQPDPVTDDDRQAGLATLKSASLASTEPKPVMVEKITPSVKIVTAADVSVAAQKKAESNVCTLVHKRKVMISKYKWRCK
jgi:hypothetical protein